MEALETQTQATQEKENAVTKQNMKYTMSSSRGIYLSWLTGRIYSTILADHEKLTIDIKPVKKNMIPVIYYEDITAIFMNYKIPGYYIFFICLAVISCFSNPGMIVFVFLFIWAGSNRKITICLRSGNKAIVYARRKKIATAFVATVAATGNKNFNRFMGWADAARQLLVMTNADNPRDAQQAVDLGAEGIGLCRTEHMFFAEDRIKAVREMICARTVEEREAALAKVEPFQQGDFEAMYRIMGERPMTIRYLDPPLHEFLPTKDEDIKELAADMGMTFDDLKNVVASLHEFNPMMGHRGCRLAVTYPEIAAMQTRAVIKAALNVSAETGCMITPHIMIPLVGEVKELKFVKDVVVKVADELIAAAGVDMKYQVGTMIEIPRAALTAGEIAKEAEFFSFGTNDLTQMTFGFSRDDAAKFLGAYYENKIYESDPFQHLDQIGVGKLVKMAAHDGRETRPDLGLGICGEHGGDPTSVEFCHNVGLDYVSCSPFRVPIARLAAAQAAIKKPRA